MASKRHLDLAKKKFNAIIADEAHYLKSKDAKRSKNLIPVLQNSKRVILLSGTPVLNKPVEIHNIMMIIRPDVTPSFKDFTNRYCNPKQGTYAMDYSGSACCQELHNLLSSSYMVRRLKKDVLDQLPDKRRQSIAIEVDQKTIDKISKVLSDMRTGGEGEDNPNSVTSLERMMGFN